MFMPALALARLYGPPVLNQLEFASLTRRRTLGPHWKCLLGIYGHFEVLSKHRASPYLDTESHATFHSDRR